MLGVRLDRCVQTRTSHEAGMQAAMSFLA
jgi:hypothetical protein